MIFEFATAGKILFGPGKRLEVGGVALEFGKRVVLVTGSKPERAEFLSNSLRCGGADICPIQIHGEPTVNAVSDAVEKVKEFRGEVVVGIGGGSVIDAAKAIAGLASNPGEILDYLEVIGRAQQLQNQPLPFVAVPTTAGTGAEVTRNAVLGSPEHKVKASLRSPKLLARVAVVDPELTLDLPAEITAYTGLDALTQLIEAFLCTRANPFTDAVCREGIPRAARWIEKAVNEPDHLPARAEMATASLFSGIALANAGLGAVHGFAAAIGGMFRVPHGAVCAALLPVVLEINYGALLSRAPTAAVLDRFRELAFLLTGNSAADAKDALRFISELTRRLRIPNLARWGLDQEAAGEICQRAKVASSMKPNPVALHDDELKTIFLGAL